MKKLTRSSCTLFTIAALFLALGSTVRATVISFSTDPFAGSAALTTPGRQIVGGEPSINFNIATDVFVFSPSVFGISSLHFANGEIGSLPTSGVNLIVLRTFDNDNNVGTPFGAGNAHALIAGHLTSPGPGFFIYFNQNLDLPRLVFATDLNDATGDLKILARFPNLSGPAGKAAMATITAANFAVPDSGGALTLVLAAGAMVLARFRFKSAGAHA